jgi:hypothetical protein
METPAKPNFESADPEEIKMRLNVDVFVTRVEVAVG